MKGLLWSLGTFAYCFIFYGLIILVNRIIDKKIEKEENEEREKADDE